MSTPAPVAATPGPAPIASSPAPVSAPASPPATLAVPGGARLSLAAQQSAPRPAEAAATPAQPAEPRLTSLADVVALALARRDLRLKFAIETQMRPVAFEQGRIEIALVPGASPVLVQELQNKLQEWTGRRWLVALSQESQAQTLAERAEADRAELMTGVRADPLVAAVLSRFPGASIIDVRSRSTTPPPATYDEIDASAGDGPGPDDEIEF